MLDPSPGDHEYLSVGEAPRESVNASSNAHDRDDLRTLVGGGNTSRCQYREER